MITKRIAAAQKAVEAQNFASRKHILEYDDVMNKQRQAVYAMRRALLEGEDQQRTHSSKSSTACWLLHRRPLPRKNPSQPVGLERPGNRYPDPVRRQNPPGGAGKSGPPPDGSGINEQLVRKYEEKEAMVGPELMRETERMIMLNVIDNQWKDHLLSMDHLKEGIGLRGYGQKDPLIEYKKESYILFQDMMDRIEDETIRWLFFMQRTEAQAAEASQNVPHPELWADEPKRKTRRRRKPAL